MARELRLAPSTTTTTTTMFTLPGHDGRFVFEELDALTGLPWTAGMATPDAAWHKATHTNQGRGKPVQQGGMQRLSFVC